MDGSVKFGAVVGVVVVAIAAVLIAKSDKAEASYKECLVAFDAKKFEAKIAESKTRIEALKKTPGTGKIAVAPATAANVMVSDFPSRSHSMKNSCRPQSRSILRMTPDSPARCRCPRRSVKSRRTRMR